MDMQIYDGMKQAYVDYAQSVMVSKQIETFNNPHFGEIRTAVDDSGEPWFCLADICKALDLTAKGVRQRLDDGVISNYPITDALGREQQAIFVNEDGLYDAILDSRKPEARAYRKWITGEVLPSIRKAGQYSLRPLTQGQMLVQMAQAYEAQERMLMEQQRRQSIIEHKVEVIENRIENNGFMSVMGFANIHHLNIGTKAAAAIGRLASKWCKRNLKRPEKTKHERWGEVNTYPMEALKICFTEFYPDKTF